MMHSYDDSLDQLLNLEGKSLEKIKIALTKPILFGRKKQIIISGYCPLSKQFTTFKYPQNSAFQDKGLDISVPW